MRPVDNALEVLELVVREQPVGVSDVARATGLPKSTAQRSLLALAEKRWLEQDIETGKWRPAARALVLGIALVEDHPERALALIAAPFLRQLLADTGESIHLVVPDGTDVVLVERLASPRAVTVRIPAGVRIPMHWAATGKAILAALPASEVAAHVNLSLQPATEHAIVDLDRLEHELAEVRSRGWSHNRGEWNAEVRAVAAAISDRTDRPVAAVSISCPPHRLDGDRWAKLGELVRRTADSITSVLAGRDPGP